MDELLKSVRLTDDLKLDVYKQGKRRKYALFHDENNTKSEKYDVSLSDDQVIEESLYVYNKRNNKIYEVIQDPYKNDVNSNNSEYIVTVNTTIDQTISDETPKSPTQSVPKNKLIIDGLPKEIKIKAKDNLPIFTVWTSPIPKNNDYNNELGELDEEYMESGYQGLEETGIDFEYWKTQDDISNSQEDVVNYDEIEGSPADIKPYSSLDELLKLAGRCAIELGKNKRVNYENLRSGYKKGIHGLCPQGTLSVLYALTGIKSLGKIRGNADWFSFKSPTNPIGGEFKGDFSKTGYYNQKVKITQINGSWKGTYLHNDSKSQWQIGDIIAMGYINGRNYGHIQVWTGYCWMSDFKQNSIQQNNVDTNSVALWRLNSKGIEAVNKQKNLN